MTSMLSAMVFLQALAGAAVTQQQADLASLIPAAEVVVAARLIETDYSRTPSDGPMTARATVLRVVKGGLKAGQSITFTETAFVGPNYQKDEVRVLFLEPAGLNSWRVLSNLYAKADFFIAPDAIPLLNMNSLRSALERLPAPALKSVLITGDMLR